MEDKTRMTRQGIRDLNYYGPRRPTTTAKTPEPPKAVEAATSVPSTLEVPAVVEPTNGA